MAGGASRGLVLTQPASLLWRVSLSSKFEMNTSLKEKYHLRDSNVGFVESLNDEVCRFGIQSIIFEPGQFRTPVLSSARKTSDYSTDADYKDVIEEVGKDLENSNGAQKGDPQKGVSRMIDVVKGEGMAQGRIMPLRMPIGPDSLRAMREKCEETLRVCGKWEGLIGSTNFDVGV